MTDLLLVAIVSAWAFGLTIVALALWIFNALKKRPFDQGLLPITMLSVIGVNFERALSHGLAIWAVMFGCFAALFAVAFFRRSKTATIAFVASGLWGLASFYHAPFLVNVLFAASYVIAGSIATVYVAVATFRPISQAL